MRDLGAEIIVTAGMDYGDREKIVNEIASSRNMMIISTGNHLDIIEGDFDLQIFSNNAKINFIHILYFQVGYGTMALELHSQVSGDPLDAIVVPVSTGGMLAGCSLVSKEINPTCKVIAVEPKGKHLAESLKARKMLWKGPRKYLETCAEGLKSRSLIPFALLLSLLLATF